MFFITDIFYNSYIIICTIKIVNLSIFSTDGKYNNLIMSEQKLEKITNISMKNFRKQNHFCLKDVLEKQPTVVGYRKAFFTILGYDEIFFIYDSIDE